MPNASNTTAAKPKITGAIFFAPVGTTLPTTAAADLNEAFVELGYLSDAGLVNDFSVESDEVKAWGGDTVLTLQTGSADNFKFKLLEVMDPNVLKAVYGSENVTGTLSEGITVKVNSTSPESHSFVFDMILRGGALKRVVVPNASITERSEVSYVDSEAVGYEVTITAVPDTQGNTHYEYIAGGGND